MAVMSIFTSKSRATHRCGVAFALGLFCAASLCGTRAKAQNNYTMNISEKELRLAHPDPNDAAWNKWLATSDIGAQRMMERSMPYIELQNAATSSSPITEFHLTIGDSRFNFTPDTATGVVGLGTTTPGFDLSGSQVTQSGDELVVTIGNGGLLPGHLVRFQIKLAVDPAFKTSYAASFGAAPPDYRTVLFDINADGGSTPIDLYGPEPNLAPGASDNASAYVLFGNVKSSTTTLADATVDANGQAVNGQYHNNSLRPHGAQDNVNLFQTDAHEIPEPGSIALAVLGFVPILLRRRGR
jgi:hypothetical protein